MCSVWWAASGCWSFFQYQSPPSSLLSSSLYLASWPLQRSLFSVFTSEGGWTLKPVLFYHIKYPSSDLGIVLQLAAFTCSMQCNSLESNVIWWSLLDQQESWAPTSLFLSNHVSISLWRWASITWNHHACSSSGDWWSPLQVLLFSFFWKTNCNAVSFLCDQRRLHDQLYIATFFWNTLVEECDLHRRIGLRVLLLVGSTPSMVFLIFDDHPYQSFKNFLFVMVLFTFIHTSHHHQWIVTITALSKLCMQVLLGFMLPTALLSMWISNTASTAMMVYLRWMIRTPPSDLINTSTRFPYWRRSLLNWEQNTGHWDPSLNPSPPETFFLCKF